MLRRYRKLGEILLEKGFITREELDKALEIQKEKKKPLGEVLIETGYITEDQLLEALSEQYGVPILKELPKTYHSTWWVLFQRTSSNLCTSFL